MENNRPDIVLCDKHRKVTWLIDVAIPLASNIGKKYTEKVTKYRSLSDQIREVWTQDQVMVVPVILGATGEIPHSLHESLKTLSVPPSLYTYMQKSVLLDTCHLVRRYITTPMDRTTVGELIDEHYMDPQ